MRASGNNLQSAGIALIAAAASLATLVAPTGPALASEDWEVPGAVLVLNEGESTITGIELQGDGTFQGVFVEDVVVVPGGYAMVFPMSDYCPFTVWVTFADGEEVVLDGVDLCSDFDDIHVLSVDESGIVQLS